MGYCDMTGWPQVAYTYDGSFNGFLTCVYESYVHRERAAAFSARSRMMSQKATISHLSFWEVRAGMCLELAMPPQPMIPIFNFFIRCSS